MTKQRIALFFGSFNPIHNGHISIAKYIIEHNYANKLWFVISPQNPLKDSDNLLDENKRYAIAQLATSELKYIEVSDFEFSLERPSYTFQSLKYISNKYPNVQFILVLGGDNLQIFRHWKNYQNILNNYPILVYPRKDAHIHHNLKGDITIIDAPLCDISSTKIRSAVKRKQDISMFVPNSIVYEVMELYKFNLLLHTCCAPCSSAIITSLLEDDIMPTIYFYNPNIFPLSEYNVRKTECIRFANELNIPFIDGDYSHAEWLTNIKGLEEEPERGARCLKCFIHRLTNTAKLASEKGFTHIATTLASSRWKNLEQINTAGESAVSSYSTIKFWANNWRKGGLSALRNKLLKEYNFYNQQYCGCEFSKNK